MKSFEYNERTAQDKSFEIACALEQSFNIKSLDNEDTNAYAIESSLNHIMSSMGFIIVKVEL